MQVNQDTPRLEVQSDGFIYFLIDVPELGDAFFNRHHLQINIPYFSGGRRKNHYIEVAQAGVISVSIPSDEPVGTPIYLYDGEQRFIKSTAERVIIPVVQFFAVYEMLQFVGRFGELPFGPSIDFKNGAFLEGIQGYVILDSSLRFARDATEHMEVYYQMDPGASSMTVVIIFATGAMVLNGVPIDTGRFNVLAMQKSFIYSGMAGKTVDAVDELLITPEVSEKIFPSRSSVRSFKSKMASQLIRGPVLSAGLSRLDLLEDNDKSISPAKWLFTKKLMIKSVSETRQFNEMAGQSIEILPDRVVEWGLNGTTMAISGHN